MSMNLRFPNITAATPAEQINQIKSYLHQLVEQLNWALATLESTGTVSESSEQPAFNGITEESFNELKSLIAQSTAMLDSYYDKINTRLEGQYVLQSDFDNHKQDVYQRLVPLEKSVAEMDTKYASQADLMNWAQTLDEHMQEASANFAGLDEKYTSKTDFGTYTQENTQAITDLQQSIIVLTQRIDEMQYTGGEENG